jgi:hypothetical protein
MFAEKFSPRLSLWRWISDLNNYVVEIPAIFPLGSRSGRVMKNNGVETPFNQLMKARRTATKQDVFGTCGSLGCKELYKFTFETTSI